MDYMGYNETPLLKGNPMQNEVNFGAIEVHANILNNLQNDNRALKNELYDLLRSSDVSEVTIMNVRYMLTQYDVHSEMLVEAIDKEKKRHTTIFSRILSKF